MLEPDTRQVVHDLLVVASLCAAARRFTMADRLVAMAVELLEEVQPPAQAAA